MVRKRGTRRSGFKIGDSVVVKAGVTDPDFGADLGGWQGRIIEIQPDPDDEMACFHAWEEHLTRHLVFPFEAEVDEFQERGPLQSGDGLKVTGIAMVDDLCGVIVDVWRGRRAAILHHGSPLLITAGPGSGKTEVLTWRVAHLVRAGLVAPGHLLVTTFP